MIFRTNVALAIMGERVEKNTEVELTKEQAAIFDPADLSPVDDSSSEVEETVVDSVPLEEMSLAQLKVRAAELKVSTAGSKADLQERITLALQAQTEGMIDHVITDEDVAAHPEWFDARPDGSVVRVGDTIKAPAADDITNQTT